MPEANTLELYKAYVENVNEFLIAEKQIKRIINRALKENKNINVSIQTKLYALLFSTYSESSFMKMIYTPYGFDQKYIQQILKQESIHKKWFKTVELAFSKFSAYSKNAEIPNKSKELKNIIQEYIIEPSIIRNKIAHGQIKIALNSKNTSLNNDLSNSLNNLDFVYISKLFEINKKLISIIEDLIESPNKAHHNHYYSKFQCLKEYIKKTENWNTQTKMTTISMSKKIIR